MSPSNAPNRRSLANSSNYERWCNQVLPDFVRAWLQKN